MTLDPVINVSHFCSYKDGGASITPYSIEESKMGVCRICEREFAYSRSAGHRLNRCNSCGVNIRRFKIKERCVQYKGGECCRCGYKKCITALEFHHLDPLIKKFSPGGHHCRSWDKMKEELDKCILLCANCHREEEFLVASAKGRPAAL